MVKHGVTFTAKYGANLLALTNTCTVLRVFKEF